MRHRPPFAPHRLAPAVAVFSVLAACGGGASDDAVPLSTEAPTASQGAMSDDVMSVPTDADAVSDAASDDRMSPASSAAPTEPSNPVEDAPGPAGDDLSSARQRCRGIGELMERRIDQEGFEWPEEGPELSEEELDRVMAPEYAHVDGVASPDERPTIDPIPAFDPETVSILELDHLAMICIDADIASVSDVYGEDDEFDEFDEFDDPEDDDDSDEFEEDEDEELSDDVTDEDDDESETRD